MQRVVVWCAVGALLAVVGCHQAGGPPQGLDAGASGPSTAASGGGVLSGAAVAATPVLPPKPEPPKAPAPRRYAPKEIVIAWEASLMYLLKEGKSTGKPLILNGAQRQYFRDAHIGDFRISEKSKLKRSNLYDVNGDPLEDKKLAPENGAIMRNWMRIGNLAVGLHYSPAFRFHTSASRRHRSHGCYRMSRRDSDMVFKWAPQGTPVHVVRSLGGTEWAFLRESTPPELLPGYRPTSTARKSTPTPVRVTASRSRPPAAAAKKPAAPAATVPATKPPVEPAAAPPAPPAEPPVPGTLESGAETKPTPPPAGPAPTPAPPVGDPQPPAPAPEGQ